MTPNSQHDLPRAIGRPATNALHGVGPKAIRILKAELAQLGLDLAD